MLFLDVLISALNALLFRACYRPPNQTFCYEVLDDVLSHLYGFMLKECIIMADFNTAVRKKVGENYNALRSICNQFHLTQIINQSTRVWEKGESIIDLILVSDQINIVQQGVIEYGISDHYIIYCTWKRYKSKFKGHKSVRTRLLKH